MLLHSLTFFAVITLVYIQEYACLHYIFAKLSVFFILPGSIFYKLTI